VRIENTLGSKDFLSRADQQVKAHTDDDVAGVIEPDISSRYRQYANAPFDPLKKIRQVESNPAGLARHH
jgi:hypothetical protein